HAPSGARRGAGKANAGGGRILVAKVLIALGGAVICLSSCSGERPTFARRMPQSDAAVANATTTDGSDHSLADASPDLTAGRSSEVDAAIASSTGTAPATSTADTSSEATDAGVASSEPDQADACVASCSESACSN